MGRCLNFSVKNGKDITEEEKEYMFQVSEKYNNGEFEDVWTCEHFYLDPYQYYPNWQYFDVLKTCMNIQSWDFINEIYGQFRAKGMTHGETCLALKTKGLILFHDKVEEGEIRGFCKVGSNEFNAMLIFIALVEISKHTEAIIELSDEGKFLLGAVIIKDGMCKWDVEDMKEHWAHWEKEDFIKENKYRCGDRMRDQKNLIHALPGWFEPHLACRKVNPKDFMEHPEYGAGQIMAGFGGEYWNLTDEDPEKASYAMCEMFAKMVEGSGLSMEVTPKITTTGGIEKKKVKA